MPMSTTNRLTTKIGAGQRTTAVPTFAKTGSGRAVWTRRARPWLPRNSTAGPSVTAINTTTTMPIATGAPMVLK